MIAEVLDSRRKVALYHVGEVEDDQSQSEEFVCEPLDSAAASHLGCSYSAASARRRGEGWRAPRFGRQCRGLLRDLGLCPEG